MAGHQHLSLGVEAELFRSGGKIERLLVIGQLAGKGFARVGGERAAEQSADDQVITRQQQAAGAVQSIGNLF